MSFEPPADWQRITTIDAHAAGEPLRVITGGMPDIPGETILAKREYAREHLDQLRRALMLEPRGHADMYGCILTPPVEVNADKVEATLKDGVLTIVMPKAAAALARKIKVKTA